MNETANDFTTEEATECQVATATATATAEIRQQADPISQPLRSRSLFHRKETAACAAGCGNAVEKSWA